jgi:hypothetical protein
MIAFIQTNSAVTAALNGHKNPPEDVMKHHYQANPL